MSELDKLSTLLVDQNREIEQLENELNNLKLKQNDNHDPNAEQLKKLSIENDKLKYRINILKSSIEEASTPKPSEPVKG